MVTTEHQIQFILARAGQKRVGTRPPKAEKPPGRIPRVAKLMALAIHFDELIRSGAVADQTALARIGHVTSPRVTQIMNLLCLTLACQDTLLFMLPIDSGRPSITEKYLRPIAADLNWVRQRRAWSRAGGPSLINSTDEQQCPLQTTQP